MAIGEIHVGDVGTIFLVTIKDENDTVVDVSTSVGKTLIFKKPDGTILSKTASFSTDGTNGEIQYTTIDGDLDLHGKWAIQAFIDFGSTEWYSDIDKFTVYNNLGC